MTGDEVEEMDNQARELSRDLNLNFNDDSIQDLSKGSMKTLLSRQVGFIVTPIIFNIQYCIQWQEMTSWTSALREMCTHTETTEQHHRR